MAATEAFFKDNVLNYASNRELISKTGVVKVLCHISGPLEDGTVVKELADSKLYMKAIFTKSSLDDFIHSYDDSFSSPPDWDQALLLLNQHHVKFQRSADPGNEEGRPRFILLVERFTLVDLHEGFCSKRDVFELMADPDVKKKAAEMENLHNSTSFLPGRSNQPSRDTQVTDSECLSQLLAEMGKSSVTVDVDSQQSHSSSQDQGGENPAPRESSCQYLSLQAVLHAMRSLNPRDFIVSSQEQAVLHSLPEWKTDYSPPAGCSSDGPGQVSLQVSASGSDPDAQGRNFLAALQEGSTLKSGVGETADENPQHSNNRTRPEVSKADKPAEVPVLERSEGETVGEKQSCAAESVAERDGARGGPDGCSEDRARVSEAGTGNSSEESPCGHPSVSFTCSSPEDLECPDGSAHAEVLHHPASTSLAAGDAVCTGSQPRNTADASPDSTSRETQRFAVTGSQGFSPSEILLQDVLPLSDEHGQPGDSASSVASSTTVPDDEQVKTGAGLPVVKTSVTEPVRCDGTRKVRSFDRGETENNVRDRGTDGVVLLDDDIEMLSPDCQVFHSTQKAYSSNREPYLLSQSLSPIALDSNAETDRAEIILSADREEEERIQCLIHDGRNADSEKDRQKCLAGALQHVHGKTDELRGTVNLSVLDSQDEQVDVSAGKILANDSEPDTVGSASDMSQESVILVPGPAPDADLLQQPDGESGTDCCPDSGEVVVVLSSGDDAGADQEAGAAGLVYSEGEEREEPRVPTQQPALHAAFQEDALALHPEEENSRGKEQGKIQSTSRKRKLTQSKLSAYDAADGEERREKSATSPRSVSHPAGPLTAPKRSRTGEDPAPVVEAESRSAITATPADPVPGTSKSSWLASGNGPQGRESRFPQAARQEGNGLETNTTQRLKAMGRPGSGVAGSVVDEVTVAREVDKEASPFPGTSSATDFNPDDIVFGRVKLHRHWHMSSAKSIRNSLRSILSGLGGRKSKTAMKESLQERREKKSSQTDQTDSCRHSPKVSSAFIPRRTQQSSGKAPEVSSVSRTFQKISRNAGQSSSHQVRPAPSTSKDTTWSSPGSPNRANAGSPPGMYSQHKRQRETTTSSAGASTSSSSAGCSRHNSRSRGSQMTRESSSEHSPTSRRRVGLQTERRGKDPSACAARRLPDLPGLSSISSVGHEDSNRPREMRKRGLPPREAGTQSVISREEGSSERSRCEHSSPVLRDKNRFHRLFREFRLSDDCLQKVVDSFRGPAP